MSAPPVTEPPAPEDARWNLFCTQHGCVTIEPVLHDEATETQNDHIQQHAGCELTTTIRRR
jgi:hypothetical protein